MYVKYICSRVHPHLSWPKPRSTPDYLYSSNKHKDGIHIQVYHLIRSCTHEKHSPHQHHANRASQQQESGPIKCRHRIRARSARLRRTRRTRRTRGPNPTQGTKTRQRRRRAQSSRSPRLRNTRHTHHCRRLLSRDARNDTCRANAGSGFDFDDVGFRGIKHRRRDGDLLIIEIVDHISRAQKRISEKDRLPTLDGEETECACCGAVAESEGVPIEISSRDGEFVEGNRYGGPTGAAESEVQRAGVLGDIAVDNGAVIWVVDDTCESRELVVEGGGEACKGGAGVEDGGGDKVGAG